MNTFEIIIFFCTIFGTIVAYLSYKSSTSNPLREGRRLLLEKLDFLKRINNALTHDLTNHATRNNCFNQIFMQGLTYIQCIDLLKKVDKEVLNEENYNAVRETASKMRIDEIAKHIDTQIKHHSEIRTYVDYFVK